MPDLQQELAQILTTVKHDGEILTFFDPPQRAIITTPEIVLQFMRGAEQIIGLRGAKVLMYSTGFNVTYPMAERIRATTEASLEQAFGVYIHNMALRGWGKLEIVECSLEKGTAVGQATRSIFAEGYSQLGEPVCNFYAGALAGMLAGYRGKRAVAREIACQAAGSARCRFEVESAK